MKHARIIQGRVIRSNVQCHGSKTSLGLPISLWITSRDLLSRSPRVHLSFRYRAAAEAISPFVNLFLAISDTRIAILYAVDVAIEATRLIFVR